MASQYYPASPLIPDYSFLNPNQNFKDKAYRMIIGIMLFILLYLSLIAFAGVLLVASIMGGFGIIALKPNFITLAIGFGLIALGVMFFLFLIKFIFAKSIESIAEEREINEKDQPELFAFIRQLTTEVKTRFPKKIYLIPDVNASVSYNSSFWSMFLPVRKNLRIGLGLVNSLTISEFKAALAHEFGHFSQRSMKVGSYVYTVNKVIYNLVTHHDTWDQTIERWASTGGIFGFFAGITFWMVSQVRAVLLWAYNKLNIEYMALSREMEFHADLVACSVSGCEPLISTLRKIEFTDHAYQYSLAQLNALTQEKKRIANIYDAHQAVISKLAKDFKLKHENGMAITDEDLQNNIIQSRINIKDQWASHPSREDREENIRQIDIKVDQVYHSAWTLFNSPETVQQLFTDNLYATGIPEYQTMELIPVTDFTAFVNKNENSLKLPASLKGFYDNRLLNEFNIEEAKAKPTDMAFEEIFADHNREFFSTCQQNKDDLDALKRIKIEMKPKDQFEFDHEKVTVKDTTRIIQKLEREINESKNAAINLDTHAFKFFYHTGNESDQKALIDAYNCIFSLQEKQNVIGGILGQLYEELQKMQTQLRWTEAELDLLNKRLINTETTFKDFLYALPHTLLLDKLSEATQLESYVNNKSEFYLQQSSFNQVGYEKLLELAYQVNNAINELLFNAIKAMTLIQDSLVPGKFKVA